MDPLDRLVRLGLNKNEAKALDALITLGPAGAADVCRQGGIPRNKAYDSLEALAKRGLVDVQQGRPILYRALDAEMIIGNLLEEYQNDAKEVLVSFEEREKKKEVGEEDASAWMVRGERGVRRRLAELVYGAERDIFSISGYPPKYLISARTALKAAVTRGVRVRPVSMVRPTQEYPDLSSDAGPSVIEYRTVKALSTLRTKAIDAYDQKLIEVFSGMAGSGAMVILDESTAFDIVDEGEDPEKAVGILIRAPGIPRIQKATAERMLGLYTRKL